MTTSERFAYRSLPPQMLSMKEKDDDWKKENLDILESIGRQFFLTNFENIVENYGIIRGQFYFQHYVDTDEYAELISSLTSEMNVPSHLRHYDIIAQVVNTLSGENQDRPDTFRAIATDSTSSSEFEDEKTNLLHQYAQQSVSQRIKQALLAQGMDPDRHDFKDDEEAQAYQEELAKQAQALTPPQIETYMQTSYRSSAERWADHQMRANRFKYRMAEKEKKEFEDMLVADRCFRHFYLTPAGYDQETWNPTNTFFHKSPEVDYIEDGDYVGRVWFLTIPEIINRYGHKMTEEQLLGLQIEYRKNKTGTKGIMGEFLTTNSVPFKDYFDYRKMANNVFGHDPNAPITNMDDTTLGALFSPNSISYQAMGYVQVTEAYWKSQRRIGKLTIGIDEQGKPIQIIVDETVELEGIKELDSSFGEDSDEIGTIVWTWVNQTWQGVKISHHNSNLHESMYLDVREVDFEFKSDLNPYGTKLPVCGQIFNNRNAKSQSLVDLMKPYQILYNIAMNQLFEIMQREIGRFMLLDTNVLPKNKDWGDKAYEKFMLVARQLGAGIVDTSPSNIKNGGHDLANFRMIDLDESARMISRANLAVRFEQMALKQVGITPERLGDIAASSTATGVEQAQAKSYSQTKSHFTNFSNYKERVLRMDIEMSQYVQSHRDDIVVSYIRDDLSKAFLHVTGIDLLLRDIEVFIANSQETVRVLETMRQLAMSNNTMDATMEDLATIITSNSVSEIRQQLKISQDRARQEQQTERDHQAQLAQQQIEAATADKQADRDNENKNKELDRENEIKVAEIKALGFTSVDNPDVDNNGQLDLAEQAKIGIDTAKVQYDALFKTHDNLNKRKELGLKERELSLKETEAMNKDKTEKEKLKVERENMVNDIKVAKINAANRKKNSTTKKK